MAVNWYNPSAVKKSAVPGADGTNKKMMVGQLTTDQLLDPQWGFGTSFQAAGKKGQVEALKTGMSTANPADYESMDALRGYYQNKLSDLPTTENNRITSFDTQSQRGLANILSQQKAANAGSGNIGTRQFAGAQGDIVSRLTNDYMQGLGNEKARSLQDASQIQSGLSGVQNQDLQERQFQFNQGKGLSDLYGNMIATDLGREGSLPQGGESDWMSDVLPVAGMAAGAIIGGPAGAMIGGSLGGMAAGGGKTSQGATGGMQLAQILQQQQMLQNQNPVAAAPVSAGYMPANSYGYRAPTVGGSFGGYY